MMLYEIRGVSLAMEQDEFVIREEKSGKRAEKQDKSEERFLNPVEAWREFIDIVDLRGRARIGAWCEEHGRNPYTGLLKEQKA